MSSPLTIHLLGPFHVAPAEGRCSRKGEWLLALLVLRPGREVERGWLAGTLWPDTSESQALYNLRRELTLLRRVLGEDSARLRSPGPHTLTLDLTGADVDVVAFDDSIARGDLERAAALHRGPLLEGCVEGWAIEERESRAQAYLAALEALAERDVARGDFAAAVRRLKLATAADPLREGAQRALMAALAASGSHAAATQTYRELRLLLDRELGTEPAPETRALHRRLRADVQAHASPVAPTRSPPPAPTSGRVPRPITPLVGRGAEIHEIEARVCASRLVTLTGSGGVGKSRLALQVASDLAPSFAGGAWFVELAPLADPALVAPAVASVLGIPEAPGRPLVERLVGFLRGRHVFLVLDNCEHVLDVASRLAEDLLHAAADLRILATSRQSLGLHGEVAWRVPSLVEADAVALFRERARDAGDVAAVAQICRRLDRIPLAIELAAARTRVLTVAQIAARLDDRFRLLTDGSRTALPRHRTLKAAVDWGYQLLTDEEQALVRRLSVFAGGFSLEAAEAMVDGDVLDLLANLVDKSLVAFDGRYRMLETVRQYAAERLEERGESADARARHARHFLRLAEAAQPHIFGGERERAWIDRLEEENDNLRAAFDWTEADEGRAEEGLRLAAALHWFWFAGGHLREGRDRITVALRRKARAAPPVRARALAAAAYVAMWVGDYAAMPALLDECLHLARELDEPRLAAYARCGLGAAAILRGDAAAAAAPGEDAVALARAVRDDDLLVFALYWRGAGEYALGELVASKRSLREGLALGRRIGHPPAVGHTLFRLGQVAEAAGEREEARASWLESLRVLEASTDRWGIAVVLDALGRLSVATGRAEEGALLLGATEALCERIGASVMPSERQDYDRAVAVAREALGEPGFAAAWAEGRALGLEQVTARVRGGAPS